MEFHGVTPPRSLDFSGVGGERVGGGGRGG